MALTWRGNLRMHGWILLAALGACSSVPVPREELANWELDPRACLDIRLQSTVPVKASVVESPAALPGRSWYVLEYVEQPNVKGFVTARPDEFLNVYLVNGVRSRQGGPAASFERYVVIDNWSTYPQQGLKICRQWTLREDRSGALVEGTLQLLGLTGGNLLLRESRLSLAHSDLRALASLYKYIREFFTAAAGLQQEQGRPLSE